MRDEGAALREPVRRGVSGRRVLLVAALAGVAISAACTLNPQPLPPQDLANGAVPGDSGVGTGFSSDAGVVAPERIFSDAAIATNTNPYDATTAPSGPDASDASDGSADAN